ncbi:hypothetical protein I2I05_12915 [Hymenobacter sp. BT683]|uniref:Peptidase M56 domain-containing protein n=1 Tax=Hymenobacter jeongseonensis TaxID=2791027 RepID=A0ABS0IIV1_9BACT|nr:M56 family metallopeptidase [Hymenobacter jeongseonensis]MBF9238299.1 hypothetical protein [Hymenobacter jeongseonensis]
MNALENFVSPALMRALGWTLLHSLWQGALVAGVLAGGMLLLRRQRAEVRYIASAGALGAVVALAGITFGIYFNSGAQKNVLLSAPAVKSNMVSPPKQKNRPAAKARPIRLAAAEVETPFSTSANGAASATSLPEALASPAVAATSASSSPARPRAAWLTASLRYFDNHLPLFVVAWLLGLLAMSLRMVGGLLYVQRLRHHRVRPLGAVWQARLTALAERSGVRRPVALLESALVQVPLVVGHLRPVILLPLGVVAGLPPASLEAILAHEIAHVMRRDYLVNLLQTAAEVLFFYHPAVWFLANCVRTERENCCDDAATALCGGDSLRLARALTALAEWSQSAVVPANPRLALAAMGGRGALLSRVRRLVQRRPAAPTLAEGLMAGALVLGGLGLLGSSVAFAGPLTEPAKPAAFDWQAGSAQTAPKAVGAGDTLKFVKVLPGSSNAGSLQSNAFAWEEDGHHLVVVKDEFGANRLVLEQDTSLRNRTIRRRPGRVRDNRRVIIRNAPGVAPLRSNSFERNPGTVVITKDKKGRLTDLVVNGQRVETETGSGKRKLKIKDKGGKKEKNQQFEVIRLAPQGSPEVGSYIFRGNGGAAQFERRAPGTVEYRTLEPGQGQGAIIYRDVLPKVERLNVEQLNRLNGNFRVLTPRLNQNLNGNLGAQREALRTAESALREASAVKNLSTEQRTRLTKRLAEVRAQLKATERNASSPRLLRLNGSEFENLNVDLGNQEELLEALRMRQEGGQQDRQEVVVREQRREELQERIRESQRELRDLDRARSERSRSNEEAMIAELQKDGLIKDRNNFQFKLTAKSLVVNGKEQPKKVLEKYLKLYETTSGRKMGPNSTMTLSRNGDANDGTAPTPPAPPRAPRAPRSGAGFNGPAAPMAPPAPAAFQAPAPPRPPKAPSVDTKQLSDELRKDGLIGQTDRSFQMQLNDAGLTVNGKRQSDELAAKYRKLVGHDRSGQVHNLSVSFDD